MLLFKKRFIEAIRNGEKTQTIRVWKYCRMRAGQRSYIPGVGYIKIHAIDIVELDDLTEEDAAKDGFTSAEELCSEVRKFYAESLQQGHAVYRICFQVLPDEEQERIKAEKKAKKESGAE